MARFLILEDDTQFAELLAASIRDAHHDVILCGTSSAALEAFEKEQIDIVIADVFIKDDEGFSQDGGIVLVSTLKQARRADIPVIAISGAFGNYAGDHVASSIVTVGADVTLTKPFEPQELLEIASRLLERRLY